MLASRTHRRTIICALICALLASALTCVAPASANERTQVAGALAQERYYSSYGVPETIDAGTSAGEAQERYYSSYGEPEPLTLPQSPAPSDDSPVLIIGLSIAAGLAVVAVGATQLRRVRIRRRRAARVTA